MKFYVKVFPAGQFQPLLLGTLEFAEQPVESSEHGEYRVMKPQLTEIDAAQAAFKIEVAINTHTSMRCHISTQE